MKSGEHSEDLRVKVFIIARDPFRRSDAHELLERSTLRDPMPPDDLYQQAQLFIQEGRLLKAASASKDPPLCSCRSRKSGDESE